MLSEHLRDLQPRPRLACSAPSLMAVSAAPCIASKKRSSSRSVSAWARLSVRGESRCQIRIVESRNARATFGEFRTELLDSSLQRAGRYA